MGIEGNEAADRAAKEAITMPGLHVTTIPASDTKPAVRSKLRGKWQQEWDSADRHLSAIKPKIAHWQSAFQANRRWETILCRLRIGHTRLTHGYHMSGAEAPICEHCPGPPRLTVKHILITCTKYTPIRRKYNLPESLSVLLNEHCPVGKLMEYLKDAEIYDHI